MKHTTALAALVLTAMTLSSAAADNTLPKAFHGDWCPIDGKHIGAGKDLYRRGDWRCPNGIRITANGYSHKTGHCRLTGMFEGPKAFLAGFDCKAKGDPEVEPANMWVRMHKGGHLNMWPSDTTP
jgi:hypothetical protein